MSLSQPAIASTERQACTAALKHCPTHFFGVYNTGKLQEQTIAGGLDDAATVFGDLRVDKLPPVGFQSRQGRAVVATHEQEIAHHIG